MPDSMITPAQAAVCRRFGAGSLPVRAHEKVGLARNTGRQQQPLNGLRHAPEDGTSGWFIWAGEQLSQSPDFFVPVHAVHLSELLPEVERYLALPPGWRFLIAGDYEDVWFDPSLLNDV